MCLLFILEFRKMKNLTFFQTEVSQMSAQYELLFLCGDFNSQTAELADYTTCAIQNFIGQKSVLEANGIRLTRNSYDTKVNNHGHRLIKLCKNNTIIIVNGRFQHVSSSHLTFRLLYCNYKSS